MQRDTSQRRAIRRALEDAGRPLGALEVLEASKSGAPGLGIATVYRNIKALLEADEISEVQLPGEPPRYEAAGKDHHHHFRCERCEKVYELGGACLPDLELPVIDRPRSLDTYIGGETQADGLEISYLFPTPFYLTATGGVYNKLGAGNTRADNAVTRPMDNFTYLGRLAAYTDLGDDHSLELGVSEAWTPKRFVMDTSVAGTDFNGDGTPDTPNTSAGIQTRKNTWRTLSGLDFTYRWQPASGGLYKGLIWGTEVMQNNERRFDPTTNLPRDRVRSYAGFSYLEFKVGRRWRPGVMVDLTEDLDTARKLTRTFTGFITYDVTEFQRLRVALSRTTDNRPTGLGSNTVALQWSAVLGHHVHGFRDR